MWVSWRESIQDTLRWDAMLEVLLTARMHYDELFCR